MNQIVLRTPTPLFRKYLIKTKPSVQSFSLFYSVPRGDPVYIAGLGIRSFFKIINTDLNPISLVKKKTWLFPNPLVTSTDPDPSLYSQNC
jgi:hypothetical protein